MNGLSPPGCWSGRSMLRAFIASTVLWPLVLVRAEVQGAPASGTGVALMPGAQKVLGISWPSEAGTALARAFDDAFDIQVREGANPRTLRPSDCIVLLEVQDHIAGTRPPGDWSLLQRQLAVCHILRWLSHGAAAGRSALPSDISLIRETRVWPASTWPAVSADEATALARPGQTLQSASARRLWQVLTPQSSAELTLGLESHGYALRLQLLAKGDFDGDGWEDWLMLWQAHGIGGQWSDTRGLLVTRQSAGEVLSVQTSKLLNWSSGSAPITAIVSSLLPSE
jgi:hypothetical protein